jgi:hypothetical protein
MHHRKWIRIPFGLRDYKREVVTDEMGHTTVIHSCNIWPSWKAPITRDKQ